MHLAHMGGNVKCCEPNPDWNLMYIYNIIHTPTYLYACTISRSLLLNENGGSDLGFFPKAHTLPLVSSDHRIPPEVSDVFSAPPHLKTSLQCHQHTSVDQWVCSPMLFPFWFSQVQTLIHWWTGWKREGSNCSLASLRESILWEKHSYVFWLSLICSCPLCYRIAVISLPIII